jgi:phytanoyl-CoA hydroxylase
MLMSMNTPSATATIDGLNQAELAHFHERGWVIKRQLCDTSVIARMAAEIDSLHEQMAHHAPDTVGVSWEENLPAGKPKRIRQLMHSHVVAPSIDAVSRSEAVLAVMRQLIGPDVALFHSKLMMKAAQDGSFTPWHQDFQYWQYEAKLPTQVNCMLFVDGADEANGCLRMVDGSQKLGLLPIKRMASKSFSIGLDGDLSAYPEASLLPMQPGDAVFFGPLVIHGSGPNTSDHHRRANTFAFDAPGNRLKGELASANWRCGRRF